MEPPTSDNHGTTGHLPLRHPQIDGPTQDQEYSWCDLAFAANQIPQLARELGEVCKLYKKAETEFDQLRARTLFVLCDKNFCTFADLAEENRMAIKVLIIKMQNMHLPTPVLQLPTSSPSSAGLALSTKSSFSNPGATLVEFLENESNAKNNSINTVIIDFTLNANCDCKAHTSHDLDQQLACLQFVSGLMRSSKNTLKKVISRIPSTFDSIKAIKSIGKAEHSVEGSLLTSKEYIVSRITNFFSLEPDILIEGDDALPEERIWEEDRQGHALVARKQQ